MEIYGQKDTEWESWEIESQSYEKKMLDFLAMDVHRFCQYQHSRCTIAIFTSWRRIIIQNNLIPIISANDANLREESRKKWEWQKCCRWQFSQQKYFCPKSSFFRSNFWKFCRLGLIVLGFERGHRQSTNVHIAFLAFFWTSRSSRVIANGPE